VGVVGGAGSAGTVAVSVYGRAPSRHVQPLPSSVHLQEFGLQAQLFSAATISQHLPAAVAELKQTANATMSRWRERMVGEGVLDGDDGVGRGGGGGGGECVITEIRAVASKNSTTLHLKQAHLLDSSLFPFSKSSAYIFLGSARMPGSASSPC
jgi:hypothetical protein